MAQAQHSHGSAPAASATPAYDALPPKKRQWVDELFLCGRVAAAASRKMGYKAPEQHGWRMSKNVDVKAAIRERLDALEIRANEVLYRVDQRAQATAEDFLTFEEVERSARVRVPLAEVIERRRRELALEQRYLRAIPEDDEKRRDKQRGLIASIERAVLRLEVELEEDPDATGLVDGPVETHTVARFDLARMRDAGKLHLVKSVKEDKDGGFKVELHDAAHADDLLAKVLGLTGPKGTEDDPLHTVTHTVTDEDRQRRLDELRGTRRADA